MPLVALRAGDAALEAGSGQPGWPAVTSAGAIRAPAMDKLCQRQVATRATARTVQRPGCYASWDLSQAPRTVGTMARSLSTTGRCHKVDAEGGGASWRARIC